MKATAEDFTKVLSVVKEQVGRALEIQPATFEQFRNKLQHLTYAEITNIWQQERRHKEEFESQARPIVYDFTLDFCLISHVSASQCAHDSLNSVQMTFWVMFDLDIEHFYGFPGPFGTTEGCNSEF